MQAKLPAGVINAIDKLYELKNEIKMAKDEADECANTIKTYMSNHGLDVMDGRNAQAIYSTREGKEIDTEAYFDLLDGDIDKLLASVTVRMDPKEDRAGARSYLGEEDIESICAPVEIPVLRIKRLVKQTKETPQPKKTRTRTLARKRSMTA